MKNISSSKPSDKLIFALDAPGFEEALSWIELLSGHVGMFKVGKELFTAVGPKIVESIKQRGGRVFLDLKFHDIPNTVARAAEAAVGLNVDMFNVHASGGVKMIRETVDAVAACAEKRGVASPIVLAVTVLTSLNNSDLEEIGFKTTTNDLVLHLAKMAQHAGAAGVVASPQDIAALRRDLGEKFVIVTPGIRSSAEPVKDDQKRTLSAFEAIQTGADYIVVGRPIRQAKDPLDTCRRIVEEIADGLAARNRA
ncbi:MAG: orotidine-5'-phosphate decarboxylase [Deltaproteobacteria bacterium HGW-Deltaproteobacteria-6]|jgi:orotidine-5'-phosphate decarboxylase|nr:MAG: orotidine-5'-phosphate decarboxylase [Deltaproteobacteria bacterium HGW-Deltaproteobacteria-6]